MKRATILCLHSGNAGDFRALPEALDAIYAARAAVVPLFTVASHLAGGTLHELPERVCCLTFDDGMDMDFVDVEHPVHGPQPSFARIMREAQARHGGGRSLHATSFVIASPLARATIQERDMLGYPWMSDRWWNPAVASGYFHIANHSWDHVLPALDTVRQREQVRCDFTKVDTHADADWQVRRAREMIELICPNPGAALFAYPFGQTNEYLVREYFPRHAEEHRTLAAVSCGAAPVTAQTSRWDMPRYVFGVDWRDAADLAAILRE